MVHLEGGRPGLGAVAVVQLVGGACAGVAPRVGGVLPGATSYDHFIMQYMALLWQTMASMPY